MYFCKTDMLLLLFIWFSLLFGLVLTLAGIQGTEFGFLSLLDL